MLDKHHSSLKIIGVPNSFLICTGNKICCWCRSRGAVTWFPVHCTSINNTNTLISGDNKGTAAQLLEKWGAENASSPFIAAFAQANVGDTSPNTQGAFCLDTSELMPCSPSSVRLLVTMF